MLENCAFWPWLAESLNACLMNSPRLEYVVVKVGGGVPLGAQLGHEGRLVLALLQQRPVDALEPRVVLHVPWPPCQGAYPVRQFCLQGHAQKGAPCRLSAQPVQWDNG
jgi:hypothetical protein